MATLSPFEVSEIIDVLARAETELDAANRENWSSPNITRRAIVSGQVLAWRKLLQTKTTVPLEIEAAPLAVAAE